MVKEIDKYIKKVNTNINELWQSQKKDFGKKGLLYMSLFLLTMGLLLIIPFSLLDDYIFKIIFCYMIISFIFMAVTATVSFFYIYNRINLSNDFTKVIKFLYKVLLFICFIIWIPIIIFLKITERILNYRAKKIDNLETWLIILMFDLSVILILSYVDIILSVVITEYLNVIICDNLNVTVNKYCIFLFIVLSLLKIEMDITNIIALKLMNYFGMSRIKKEIVKKEKNLSSNKLLNNDIKGYIENKNEQLETYRTEQDESLKYDIEYQKKTFWKFQLLCLIVLFTIAAFVPEILFENQSDAINVITIFTLIMLYIDKRKEWK